MKKWHWFAGLTIVGIIATLVVLWNTDILSCLSEAAASDSAPAWIQAIGSVLAIVAATFIARSQTQGALDLEAQKQEAIEKQRFEIVKALMVRAYGLSNDICTAFETHKHEDFDQINPALMLDNHHALQTLPIFEVPDGLLALDVLTISRGLATLQEGWLELREAATPGEEPLEPRMEQLDNLAKEVRNISKEAITVCNKEIAKRSALVAANG